MADREKIRIGMMEACLVRLDELKVAIDGGLRRERVMELREYCEDVLKVAEGFEIDISEPRRIYRGLLDLYSEKHNGVML